MLGLAGQGVAESLLLERAVLAQSVSQVALKLRRQANHLDVLLTGIGDSARVVQEQSTGTSWRGEITRSEDGLTTKSVDQQVSMPEIGLASVRLSGSGSAYRLEIKSVNGKALPRPRILATGDDLVLRLSGITGTPITRQTGSLDLRRPGRIPQSVSAPPLRSRAVAPPLGDMAVGSMLIGNRSFVKVTGPPVTLTLNNAPAKDALMALARLGDYGFVYVGSSGAAAQQGQLPDPGSADSGITMSFRGESYAKALNSLLMASGLQAKLDGRTLLVGTSVLSKTYGPQMSKVFRLNQVDAASALNYLGSLGAKVNVANTVTATSIEGDPTSSEGSATSTSSSSESTVVESYGAAVGPLMGLVGTADKRLNTLVLVGDPKLISVAEAYLKQIDLRKRQVAVKVEILNVQLENDATIDSSFSAKIGDTLLVSQSGKAHMNFGAYKSGSATQGTGVYSGTGYQRPGMYDRDVELAEKKIYEKEPYSAGRMQDPTNSFSSYVESVIVSSNAKTLAQPTLLVQEGEKATVRSGVSVITGVEKSELDGSISFNNTREDAGLTVELEVEKIDDNGFVTLKLDPTIAVPVPAGVQEGVAISNINRRELKSGRIRLRDRQTLILTGVIQEDDRRLASKWPLLGDLPLIGQLFRSTTSARLKNELVIIVTPSILDDYNGGSYGYGYEPGTEEATRLIGSGSNL